MQVRSVAAAFFFVALLLPQLASAQNKERAAARAGLEAYNAGDYAVAMKKFKEAEAGAEALQTAERLLVYKYLAYCEIAFGKRAEAKAHFLQALELDPTLKLDATLVSPKVLDVFAEAKATLAVAPTPVATPVVVATPKPRPTPTAVAVVPTPQPTPPVAKPSPVPTAVAPKSRGPSSFALGVRAGAVMGDAVAPSVALTSRYRPLKAGILGRLTVGGEVGFYAVTRTVDAAEESIGVYERDYALTVLPVDLLVEFEQPLGPVAVFGALGGGAAMVSGSFEGHNPYGTVVPSTAVSATSPGIHAFGGLRRALGPGSLELAVGVRRTTPLVAPEATVRVPLGGASIGLGYLYSF